jgi:hypothetical protein
MWGLVEPDTEGGKVSRHNNDRWSQDEEERLRRLVLANTTPFEIAEALGRTVSAVKSKAHALDLTLARLGNRRKTLAKWG